MEQHPAVISEAAAVAATLQDQVPTFLYEKYVGKAHFFDFLNITF